MAAARLTDLTYAYARSGSRALDGVSLDVDDGLTLVVGPSGGGKSTLLRVLNGLVPHFHGGRISGAATSAGVDVIATPTRVLARKVGFVFQDPELQAVYDTVEREVAFGLENLGVPPSAMAARIEEALQEAGATHLRGRRLSTLSGGERQRVALASVLAMRPQTVVLDEPTSQLDPEGAARVLEAVVSLRKSGRAVVISEHRFGELRRVADQVVVVEEGRAAAGDQPEELEPITRRISAPGEEVWSLHQVTAGFRDCPVLDHVDLAGHKGEVVALVGPNGAGKTTLLRTIAGTLPPLAGKVERRPGRVAYLPQNPAALLHQPTVRAEVELTLRRSPNGQQNGQQATPILEELGLLHVAERYPRDLSSGERQRAALAAVLAGHPACVLLDEPTRGMDARARIALTGVIDRLRDDGASVVLATHDTTLRDAVADRVVAL